MRATFYIHVDYLSDSSSEPVIGKLFLSSINFDQFADRTMENNQFKEQYGVLPSTQQNYGLTRSLTGENFK